MLTPPALQMTGRPADPAAAGTAQPATGEPPSLSTLFEGAAVGLAGTDGAGRIRHANAAFCILLGASAEAVLGTDLAAWADAGDQARLRSLMQAAHAAGTPGFVTRASLRGRRGPVPARLNLSALRDAGGACSGFAAVVDIMPDATPAPPPAKAGEVPFEAVFEAAPAACLVLAPGDFRILGASDQYLASTGTERAALLGRPLFEAMSGALPGSVAEGLRASLARVAASGIREWMPLQRWPARARGPRGAGPRERVWSWLNTPVLDEAGGVRCIIHRAEDVTEREADRQRLTHALKLQRVAEKAARVGGFEMGLEEGLITWSEEACAILDLPAGHASTLREALGFVVPEWRTGLRCLFKACVRNGTAFSSEFEATGARGWRKWLRIVAETERDEAGRVTAVAGALQNVSERRAVEEANQRLAERLAARVGSITDAFFTLDANFRITYANPMALEVLGLEDLLGQSLWDCPGFAPDGAIGTRLRDAARDQHTIRFEEFLRPSRRWLDVHAFPAVGGLTVTLHDVTERRREQEKLRLLEACVARMNDIVLITDAGGGEEHALRIVFVNDAFERRTGFTRAEAQGQSPWILRGPRTQRDEMERIMAAVAAVQPVRAELINHTKSGEEFWVELDMQPVADAAGQVTHWVAVNREITDRRTYQTRLEEQAELLDQVQDAILVRTTDGLLTYMNQGAERLYGWTAADWRGRTVAELLYDDPSCLSVPIKTVLARGAWAGQLIQRRQDGTRIVVEARWTLMRHADGSPRAILAVNTDITERLELEARLRQSQRLEAVGQLTGGVAHDFNNLLTVILGNAEILMESLDDNGELREMAEMTMAAAERGAALTSRLLSFSRRQALDPKVVDVNALLDGLATMLRRTIGEQVDLHIQPDEDLWPALIDPPQLENAVLNLCINARDAMPAGGRLTIATRNMEIGADHPEAEASGDLAPGRYVVVEVVDTGTGMAPEVLARAFEPFFTTKEVGQGSGLGLSMVYGFMKQSGGHVSINSMPDLGTAIRMYVPGAETRARAPATPAVMDEAGGWERVLLVEDDALVREHVATQLRELGYDVALVDQAAAALAALRDAPGFDLLFTDVVMPGGMNGLDLAIRARQLHPGLRVLLTSGHTENALSRHGAVESGVLLLKKPYRRRDLAEAIRRALDATG
ncbi:PAS domain S-box protein [Muricoccus vinaceus]|uniref:histidine kinase n=1 Tax=Muricoccus vinaceus TaxID=424704 RepID=A0ABV6INC1_9PROT